MFRTLGLRHLVVLNSRGEVVGIVARAELLESNLHAHIRDRKTDRRSRTFQKKKYEYLGNVEMSIFDSEKDHEAPVSNRILGSNGRRFAAVDQEEDISG